MTSVQPIIVAFSISGDFLDEVLAINKFCDSLKGINFSSDIPHITLWMGFVSDLDYLKQEHSKIFKSINLELKTIGMSIFKGISGEVLSLDIYNSKKLSVLQNRIHHFFEPYRVKVTKFDGMNENTILYLNNFGSKSLENYEPHVTIGFWNETYRIETENFQVSNPRIYLAGNNCTCIDVIDS